MEFLKTDFGMTLMLVALVCAMVAVAGVQIVLCIRCKSLPVRLIPVFVCLILVLLSVMSLNGQLLPIVLTACSVLLLLFSGVGWVVARLILKNQR